MKDHEYIILSLEITRLQRSLADCLWNNEHLHTGGKVCIACENAKKYLCELKEKRKSLRNDWLNNK